MRLLLSKFSILNAITVICDRNLWVVMPYMAGGYCLHILKASYPEGFEEVVIATILREVLKVLDYLHHHGHIHRDVKAGNILIDTSGAIKLGDLGVSACLFDSGDRQRCVEYLCRDVVLNEYKRGISGWNFNLEDVKAQASLIQDEDMTSDKDLGGSSSSLSGSDRQEKKFQCQYSSLSQSSEAADIEDDNLIRNQAAPLLSANSTVTVQHK